jgi:beta-glucosidase
VKSRLPRPEKELQAFSKVFLHPGETKQVSLKLDKYSVGYFDTNLGEKGLWIAEEGAFEVLIGASSVDIRYVDCEIDLNATDWRSTGQK